MAGQPVSNYSPVENEEVFAFRLTVTTSGVPVQMPFRNFRGGFEATIKALNTNTANIYVDGSNINIATSFPLGPGEALKVTPNNLNEFFIDADVNGEGVAVILWTEG